MKRLPEEQRREFYREAQRGRYLWAWEVDPGAVRKFESKATAERLGVPRNKEAS